jgi:hypothetical protein
LITVPADKYVARAKAWGFCKAGTGIDQLAILFQFKLPSGETKRLTFYGFVNSTENAKRTMATMRTCGWDGLGPATDAQGLDANEVSIVVEDDYYRAEGDSKIKYVNSLQELRINELSPEQKNELNARLAQWQTPARGLRQGPAIPKQNVELQQGDPGDDDLPF